MSQPTKTLPPRTDVGSGGDEAGWKTRSNRGAHSRMTRLSAEKQWRLSGAKDKGVRRIQAALGGDGAREHVVIHTVIAASGVSRLPYRSILNPIGTRLTV
jgi:hypothetical protein